MRLYCYECGESVSSEVPGGTILRACATCPECIEKKGYFSQTEVDRLVAEARLEEAEWWFLECKGLTDSSNDWQRLRDRLVALRSAVKDSKGETK